MILSFLSSGSEKGWMEGVMEKICFFSLLMPHCLIHGSTYNSKWDFYYMCGLMLKHLLKRKKSSTRIYFPQTKALLRCFSWWCLKLCWTSLLVPRFSLPNFPETSKLPLQHSVWSSIFHPLSHQFPAFLIHIFVSSIKRFAQRFHTSVCLFELIEKKWDQHIK